MTIFFTADTHFCHANIIEYCDRPFSSVEEMDEVLINNWNSKVTSNDEIYHLGDFGFGGKKLLQPIFERLNGRKSLIYGNHDGKRVQHLGWVDVMPGARLLGGGKCIYLNHVWSPQYLYDFHLYGHTHGTIPPTANCMDVGVDTNNYYPYSLDEIMDIMIRIKLNVTC